MERDQRIDTIRGLLLAIMTIDHFGGWLARYTSETLGYVSALEGFIFLSAFVFAQVYVRYAGTPSKLFGKSLSRALLIYRYHIILLLCIPVLTLLSGLYQQSLWNWVYPYYLHPIYYGIKALLLLHQPVYMDILPVYFILVLISPLVLLALVRNQGRSVLLVSLFFWFLSHYVNPVYYLANTLCDQCRYGFLNLFAWQLLWVSGLYLGYRVAAGRPLMISRHPLLILFLATVAVTVFLIRHQWLGVHWPVRIYSNRENLGWLRLMDFYVLLGLLALVLVPVPRRWGVPWLTFIGRYSIQVFAFHVFLAYALLPLRPMITRSVGTVGYALFTLLMVASLTIPAWAYQHYQQARQRTKMA